MRVSKEILLLLGLLVTAAAFVLGYVIQRKAAMRAAPAPAARTVGPAAPGPVRPAPATPAGQPPLTELGGPNEGKTIDFSRGQPVVKDDPADRAALEAGLVEIKAATADVVFEAPKPAPAPATPPKP